MLKIKQVINNNIVVAVDEQKDEIILFGKGLGFNQKTGGVVVQNKVEKRFFLEDKGMFFKFKKLLSHVTSEELSLSDDIISLARRELKRPLNENIYVSLPDHIHYVLKRYHDNKQVSNALLWDIKQFYPNEYHLSEQALKMINEAFQVKLAEDEAGFLALHFINAVINDSLDNNAGELTTIIHQLVTIVSLDLKIKIDMVDYTSSRFITHVKFFAQRIVNRQQNNKKVDEELYGIVKVKYAKSYETVKKIRRFLEIEYNFLMNHDEELYLMIHIHRLVSGT